jgi:hypothetical protein
MKLFIPITKVDAAKRLVYGVATAELPDRSGEVCDYATTKPFYEKWSGDISKATDGKSLGNLRSMHGHIAAGKLTGISFNDDAKQIEICAKVVDDAEWAKVEEGVYTGFSQGGEYVKRWKDPTDSTLTRYTAAPLEVSLVDLPCLPDATFSMVKADGAVEMRKFKEPAPESELSNSDVAAKATELAKAAGDATKWVDHIEAARATLLKQAEPVAEAAAVSEPETAAAAVAEPTNFDADVEQVWKSVDGKTYKKKADALKANADFRADEAAKTAAAPTAAIIADIAAALDKREGKPEPVAAVVIEAAPVPAVIKSALKLSTVKAVKAAAPADKVEALRKGLYDVGTLASLITSLNWLAGDTLYEAEYEGDASTVPAELQAAVATLCSILRVMVAEETAELVGDTVIETFEMAAGHMPHAHLDDLVKMAADEASFAPAKAFIAKAGARNSKADMARINAAHDLLVEAGAACAPAAKSAEPDGLAKAVVERDAATKALADLQPLLKDILARVVNIEGQPAQGAPTVFKVVGKDEDQDSRIEKLAATLTPGDLALLAIKSSQANGRSLIDRGR